MLSRKLPTKTVMNADEVRADVHRDLILGVQHSNVHTHVYVVINDSTLYNLDNQPGELRGFGPLPAERIRDMAYRAHATWYGTHTNNNGALAELAEKTYRPNAHLRRKVHGRDQYCQFPGCGHLAEHSDIDHLRAHRDGGPTNTGNCHALCRRHHRLKHESTWCVANTTTGELMWTSPDGVEQTAAVEPVLPQTESPPF